NLAQRTDEALIGDFDRDGIAYVPYFPLGGSTPLQSSTLSDVAGRLNATPMHVALAPARHTLAQEWIALEPYAAGELKRLRFRGNAFVLQVTTLFSTHDSAGKLRGGATQPFRACSAIFALNAY